ncbi:uncharacterized protein, YkwD family [Mesobacillus persicus]|uniref:Uncharacterized protein, YkwD family n=1 Tax=Mesobacillus persicus TaxID=930146 RepID=A0A1H8EKG4_9BACI|nr:CAP domain-containing protein [Mesobacillus persicus]SEN19886.1 uncharacterized protein, YkwD family [Mesobacillus persicus]
MINKKFGLFAAGILTLGLAACNANDHAGNDVNSRLGTSGTGNQMGTYGNNYYGADGNRNRLDTNNIGQVNDGGIDNNGPLTEDYEKEPGDLNFTGTKRNGNNLNTNNAGNGVDNYRADNDRDVNLYGKNSSRDNDEMNISSYKTNKSSKDYPHTRAILIREAKYQYVPIGRGDRQWAAGELQKRFNQRNNNEQNTEQEATPNQAQQNEQNQPEATPNEQQGQAGQAPTNQQEQAQPNQGTTNQQEQAAQPKQGTQEQQAPAGISQVAQQVIDLTNEQRKQNGLPALQADPQLSGVAQKKSVDMRQNGYFSHTSPTYGSPFDMMRDSGVSYKTAGENIAQGQQTPEAVVKAWMDSPGHRKNILSPDFTHIGVGYDASGHHWTQMFIGK